MVEVKSCGCRKWCGADHDDPQEQGTGVSGRICSRNGENSSIFRISTSRFLIHPDMGFGVDVILPEKRLIAPTLHKQIIRRELKRESLGEELRVLYVAFTRAKEKLYITGTIAKLEETLARISYGKNREETLLPGGIRCGARDFWDVILPALAGHSAMRTLYLDYGIPAGSIQECRDENAEFKIRKVTAADLIQGQIVDMTDFQIREQVIKNWDCEKVYDQEIRQALEERFEFQYPCDYLAEMPVKVSVSELKKRAGRMKSRKRLYFSRKNLCRWFRGLQQKIRLSGERLRELPIIRLWNVWIIQETIPLKELKNRSAIWKKWEK